MPSLVTPLALDVDRLIEPHLQAAVTALDGSAPLLAGMAKYHLGWVGRDLYPLPAGRVERGKRFRPLVALLSCAAAGGAPDRAAPLAAAIELLHNFTLVHDDIQDRSRTRRHRETVWSIWGDGQAINAGDALFAAAHLALYRLREEAVDPTQILDLAEAFDQMAIAIVSGQVLDLGFETRGAASTDEYLTMIAGKTAAIVRYAAWAGALLGGAGVETAQRYGAFGEALGLGFQVRDDLLGVWGRTAETGKAEADDIRRKKQSLPVLLLRSVADEATREELDAIYAAPEIGPAGIRRVLKLLERFAVREQVERRVRELHDQALATLPAAASPDSEPARSALIEMVERLATRAG